MPFRPVPLFVSWGSGPGAQPRESKRLQTAGHSRRLTSDGIDRNDDRALVFYLAPQLNWYLHEMNKSY